MARNSDGLAPPAPEQSAQIDRTIRTRSEPTATFSASSSSFFLHVTNNSPVKQSSRPRRLAAVNQSSCSPRLPLFIRPISLPSAIISGLSKAQLLPTLPALPPSPPIALFDTLPSSSTGPSLVTHLLKWRTPPKRLEKRTQADSVAQCC